MGLQGSVSFFDVTPNFTAILACHAGIRYGEARGLLVGSIIGTLEDSLSGSLLGPHLLGKGVTGYAAAFLSGKFFGWGPVLGIVVLFALSLLDGITVYAARSIFSASPTGIGKAAVIIVVQSLINAPFGFFVKKRSD